MNSNEYNCVSLIGNVASVSDIKTLPSGKKYKLFDICQNSKYIDKNGIEQENKNYFNVRLFEEQISTYESMLQKGNWIHVIGKLKNYLTEDMVKKTYITVDKIREMKPKERKDIFIYDWLNDPENDDYEV